MPSNAGSNTTEDVIVIDHDDISDYNPEQILPEMPDVIETIRSWLKATNYAHESGEYRKHLTSHMPGTGTWLTSSATYNLWLTSRTHGLLWIKGIPGSGKSVIAAHVIEDLRERSPGTPILYFFFRQIIDANHEPIALLRDWLDQLLVYSPPLQREMKHLVEQNRSLSSVSIDDLWGYLRLALRLLPGKAFCVADALDEMDDGHGEFLQTLAALGQLLPSKVKIMMTSRPIPSVELPLRKAQVLHLRLEAKMVDTDISNYVEHSLKTSGLSTTDQHLIRRAIPGRANGIFLYAKLAMISFIEPGAKIDAVSRKLPTDLHEMYTKLLHEHADRSGVPQDIQLLILQWVTHATRPLRLLELAEMIYVTYRQAIHDNKVLDIQAAKTLVRAAVGPLLEILPNETVCVLHHSFTEYLTCTARSEFDNGYPILRFGATHGRLALACIRYLQAGCLDDLSIAEFIDIGDGIDSSETFYRTQNTSFYGHEAQRTRLRYPFYDYAVTYWHLHVVRSQTAGFAQEEINLATEELFANEQRARAWLKMQWANSEGSYKGVTPLHIAARFGLIEFVHYLVAKKVEVNVVDVFGKTPLWWAASSGQADIIRVLVHVGADPDAAETVSGLKPLHKAASKNHAKSVRALLDAGVDPLTEKTRENPGRRCANAVRTTGQTPLMFTCQNGHLEALEAFLPFLTNIDTVHLALAWSAQSGRSKLVKYLLKQPGVDANAKVQGNTILFMACKACDRDSIVALIEAGADPSISSVDVVDNFAGRRSIWVRDIDNTQDEIRGSTVLHALCRNYEEAYSRTDKLDTTVLQELLGLFLEKGVPLSARDRNGHTALHVAVHSPISMRLLLHAGADADSIDDNGCTPLHYAALPDSIGLLVEEGRANINQIEPSEGRSPLLCMLHQHRKDAVLKLLEYQPSLSIKDLKGDGPLHIALRTYYTDNTIIKALLDAGADPNERNRAGETPLLSMSMNSCDSVALVDLLLDRGANINAKDFSGMTVLARSVRNYPSAFKFDHSNVEKMITRGADIHFRDYKGRSLLHHAVASLSICNARSERIKSQLDHLLALDLDLQVEDFHGNTLIHELAMKCSKTCHSPLWEQLLDLGIDINRGNHQGRTALHIVSASQPSLCSSATMTFKLGHVSPIDFIISRSKNIDQSDNQGLTALHLASTVSEFTSKKLLDAGADPTRKTVEGLTPLHLASRARQTNIVGLLVESSISKASSMINTPDTKGNTPMYYACRSGRPETVKLLLGAGADATSRALWQACAEFEEEEDLWSHERQLADAEANQDAGGLTIEDTVRPGPLPDKHKRKPSGFSTLKDTTRLEDIIEMLIEHGCDPVGLIGDRNFLLGNGALGNAMHSGHDYTLGCLIRARDSMQNIQQPYTTSHAMYMELFIDLQWNAQKKSASQSVIRNCDEANRQLILHLLKRRQYHVMRTLLEKGVNFLSGEEPNVELFIEHGYPLLLDEIGTLEVVRRFDEGKWHAFGDDTKPGLYSKKEATNAAPSINTGKQKALLSTAMKREISNMDVVRLLVEKFKVDINEFNYEMAYSQDVALAMPYLLTNGAFIDVKDRTGRTPLHVAIGGPEHYVGPFHKDAVRMLVARGANADEHDDRGRTCLAYATGDLEMVEFLLDQNVEVKADALLLAIQARRTDVLEALLKTGVNPNMRVEASLTADSTGATSNKVSNASILNPEIPLPEEFLLYIAAICPRALNYSISDSERQKQWLEAEEIMRKLLFYGADPYVTVYKLTPSHAEEDDDGKSKDESVQELLRDGCVPANGPEMSVLVHEIVDQDNMIHPILCRGNLDVNRRDYQGRTLLHMVCHNYDLKDPIDSLFIANNVKNGPSMPSFLECLMANGADPLATDASGNNVIHHMFMSNKRRRSEKKDSTTITLLTGLYPGLTNQANFQGKPPLHMALKYAILGFDTAPAEALLAAGADIFAVDNNGNGCLHILAFSIYKTSKVRTLFNRLVTSGLNINAKNKRGETPIFNLNKHVDWSGGNVDERVSAIDALLLFEEAGADLFVRDNTGRGLLHIAAKEIQEPVDHDFFADFQGKDVEPKEPSIAQFQALLSKGLDPLMEDSQNRTALDIAAACGKESVLKLFDKDDSRVILEVHSAMEDIDSVGIPSRVLLG